MNFSDLDFQSLPYGGVQARHIFNNGYGVSVVRSPMSYGGSDGLYELAVLKGTKLCYDTPITDDVLGYLTEEHVTNLLSQVESL